MIKIVTDSAADITLAQAKEMNVEIIPLKISFGSSSYYQEQDETFEQFYKMLEDSKELPSTSQASPNDYMEIFNLAKEKGDSVIVITLSGELSGTIQSAAIAKDMVGYEKIYIVDSLEAVIGQRLLVEYAVKLRETGMSAQDIVVKIEDASKRVRLFGAVDTLKYLHKGGRIPKTVELIGSVLGIKPIIFVKDGKLSMVDKARGMNSAVESMFKLIEKSGEIDNEVPVYFGHTHFEEKGRLLQEAACEKFGFKNTRIYPVGGVVGTHLGPGTVLLAYLTKKSEE